MKKKIIGVLICMLFLFSILPIIANADPTIENITTDPIKPKPLSTFTIIATITGENIISVSVTVSECTEQPPAQCFKTHINIPMTLNNEGKYEAKVTLTGTQDSIDHVQYLFIINDDGTEYQIGGLKTYLEIESIVQNDAFILGEITNLRSDGDSINFEAVNIKIIYFKPFSINSYSSGEHVKISKEYKGFIGVHFIFALVNKYEYIPTTPDIAFIKQNNPNQLIVVKADISLSWSYFSIIGGVNPGGSVEAGDVITLVSGNTSITITYIPTNTLIGVWIWS